MLGLSWAEHFALAGLGRSSRHAMIDWKSAWIPVHVAAGVLRITTAELIVGTMGYVERMGLAAAAAETLQVDQIGGM